MERHRDRFFLATKTGDRTAEGARASLERSLERLRVPQVDLIQLHNLVDEREWETALGPGGALEALVEARARGRVRFIGVTGHGTHAAEMHRRSLERFPFDSVLVPYNFTMLRTPEYAADLERLLAVCRERGVAVQTIKAVARRRWQGEGGRRFSWYEPLRDPEAIRRAVHYVLARPGLFLNSSSDATLLGDILSAAAEAPAPPADAALAADVARYEMEPLFVRGVSDAI
jgi:aryl-alcohol dehydrogenase-like predicted oxidoreductase